MKDSKITNGTCWLAYFDILGFSNMVDSFPVEFVLEKYKEALKEGKKYNVNCKFKFFSDSFIFYTENDSQDSFLGISATSELFFQEMFLGKIPMRGCLNIGQFYADEKIGIFFGRALIDAYKASEGQNWIGFILSKKTREKLVDFEATGFKSNTNLHYLEYKVPYKKEKQCKLLVYYPNILITESHPEPAEHQQKNLLDALDIMEDTAKLTYEKRPVKLRKIITKYKNTKEFLLCVYPALKERAENSQTHYNS